jgi:hypothetical protein
LLAGIFISFLFLPFAAAQFTGDQSAKSSALEPSKPMPTL